MSRTRILATLALGGALLFGAAAAQASTITCESRNNAFQSCPVDTSQGVRLTQQLSSQGCWQNDTWGYDRNGIWVDRGCRAQFQVGKSSSSSSSSGNGDALAAAAVVGLAAAAIIASNQNDDHHKNNNKHNNNNYYNYEDRYDRDYYDNYYDRHDDRYHEGTRYGYNGYGGDPRRIFLCESRGDHRNYCDIPKHGHVEVFRQRSGSPCTYGRSWGINGNSVWVDKGCRADFAVY